MNQVITLDQILPALEQINVVDEIAKGFIAQSAGRVMMPPVGELLFPEADGEMHIKYGAIKGDTELVIKVATGFFQNPNKNLPAFSGCMLVMSQKTGMLKTVLLEEGILTNHRTAAAGAVCAKYLAPRKVERIAILGTGEQARLQAHYLRSQINCNQLGIWGRNSDKAQAAAAEITKSGFNVTTYSDITTLCRSSQLIVTTTPSHIPLITKDMIGPGTHITAIGSDTAEKLEIAVALQGAADLMVTDSKTQCETRGELYHSLKQGVVNIDDVIEIGTIAAGDHPGRINDKQITIADLSGIAAQDIMIATAISERLA